MRLRRTAILGRYCRGKTSFDSVALNHFILCDNIRALSFRTTDALARVFVYAGVAKLVDALDLGSSVLRRESSSLSFRTTSFYYLMPQAGAL